MSWDKLSSANSCLVVWDMQYGIAPGAYNFGEIVINIKRLVEHCRRVGVKVFYSKHTGLPYEFTTAYGKQMMLRRNMNPKGPVYMAEGSRENSIIEELTPTEGDIVIKKHTPSFFVGTSFELMVRALGATNIMLTGVATEIGIETTARHAAALGFIPVIVSDAVGGRSEEAHKAALKQLSNMFRVEKTESILEELLASHQ
jgi:nicotinamidase-related amidase